MNRFYITVLFLFLTVSLFSQSESLPEGLNSEDLSIEKRNWNIAVSSFKGINLDTRYEYLLNALPLLIHDEISDLSNHVLSEDEIEYFRNKFLKDKIIALKKEKSSLHASRDELLFSESDEDDLEIKYEDYSEQIQEKEKLLSFWTDLNSEEIEIDEELAVLIQNYSDSDNQLLTPRVQVQRFMESEDLDLLINGSVERLDTMFYLHIEGVIQHSEEAAFSLKKIVTEEEINDVIAEGARELRTLVLGRSWSELKVNASPSNALLLIDGDSRGVGSMHLDDMEPGFITLSVVSTGFISDVRQIYLSPGAVQTYDIELEKGSTSSLALFSDPPGADVYFGSSWVGITPLFTEKPSERSQIKISKENCMPFYMDSDAVEGPSLTVQLGTDLFDKQEKLDSSKKKFYRSLGWFSISLAVPLILTGVYQNLNNRYYNYALDYNSSYDSDAYDKAIEYQNLADIAYYSRWGGIAVSASLLVNTLFKLRDYIRAAEASTEE